MALQRERWRKSAEHISGMPEGPSIVILKEQVQPLFTGCTIRRVSGNTTIDKERLRDQRVEAFRSWGKHFLVELPGFALRVHFMLFGSYRINEAREGVAARLSLGFDNGEINFYACSVRFVEEPLDLAYDWWADVMSEHWDEPLAMRRLRSVPGMLACDALLDQEIFAGVGNIIKNEVLFRIRVHPLSTIGALPPAKLRELVREARNYSFQFYEWKKQYVLRKHWLVHTKGTCPRCHIPLKKEWLGRTGRRTFYCDNCQRRYA